MNTLCKAIATVTVSAAWLPVALGQEGTAMTPQAVNDGNRACVAGVDRYRVCEPLYECVRVVLAKRGEAYTPEYLQGISGAAFRIAGIMTTPTATAVATAAPDIAAKMAQVRIVACPRPPRT